MILFSRSPVYKVKFIQILVSKIPLALFQG